MHEFLKVQGTVSDIARPQNTMAFDGTKESITARFMKKPSIPRAIPVPVAAAVAVNEDCKLKSKPVKEIETKNETKIERNNT